MSPARRLRTALAFAGIALASCLPVRAEAQDPEGTPAEAVEFYRQAREHYEAGRYEPAATALERALVLDPDSPTLVYNAARVYELLGNLDRALAMYERYQRLLPQQQAREQDRAEATIRRLQGARSSGVGSDLDEPAEVREVEPLRQLPGVVLVRENGVADSAFWITLAGGVASLAVGATFGGVALDTHSRAEGFVLGVDGSVEERDRQFDEAQTYALVSDITLGVGGAAVIAAGLLYFLREHTVERAPVDAPDAERGAGDVEADLLVDPAGGRLLAVARGSF
ncbi:MAG TPA: tetratricopeptide repeat protein [Sandaracinaceae bacterium LLY-WYZ-13_1]|nr:tetratricopeptide repeat protein [Sandaracinaceae bacterium LLY-WYZ-13_1]